LTRRKAIPIQLVRELPARSPCLLPLSLFSQTKTPPPCPTGGLGGYSTVMVAVTFLVLSNRHGVAPRPQTKISAKHSDFYSPPAMNAFA
jgi:hypothetical protein